MEKLLLIEETNFLKIRLEKIFLKIGFSDVVSFQEGILPFSVFLKKDDVYKTIVMDYDQKKLLFEKRFHEIQSYANNETQIIVLTSQSDLKLMKYLYTIGIDNIILKPFQDEILIEKLINNPGSETLINKDLLKEVIQDETSILNWCKGFEIGVEEIDKEHESIIEHFKKLYNSIKEGYVNDYFPELIKFLEHYINTHFEHEEKLQIECNYPQRKSHKKLHEDFKIQINDVITKYNKEEFKKADFINLTLMIKEWLVHHILIEDKKISDFLKQ
jgi:hemerythrin